MTDVIYVLLPLWQQQFGMSYALAGLMRGLYAGCMAGLQMQASRLATRLGRKTLLVLGTALAGLSYLLAGQARTLGLLGLALALGGLGASPQHPLASALVADAHDGDREASRRALATYNFAGDLGKMALPALLGLCLAWWSWPACAMLLGALGLFGALVLAVWLPASPRPTEGQTMVADGSASSAYGSGYRALWLIGLIDTAARMGFLTFLPFLLQSKGAGTAGTGLALSLLFVGGAFGKLVCGYLGQRLGMMKTVWLTETLTAALILALLPLPLQAGLALLPLLGLVLNGTSSVLYGTVPELVRPEQRTHAFALFYTGTIGGGALAPVLCGRIGDLLGITLALQSVAGFVCLTLPLAWLVKRALRA